MKVREEYTDGQWRLDVVTADDDGPGFDIAKLKPRRDVRRESELDSFDKMMRENRGIG